MIDPGLLYFLLLFLVFILCNIFLSKHFVDPEDPVPGYFFGNLIFTPTFVAVLSLIFFTVITKKECYTIANVTSIGGCNKNGECGVVLSNGNIISANLPTIGQSIQRCVLVYK